MPENYFYDVEAHHGGCGTYEWTKRWATKTQFALGIPFTNARPVEAGLRDSFDPRFI